MSTPRLTSADEGKTLVASNGDEIGMIAEVRQGTPYVETDPDVFEKMKMKFEWGEPDEDAYPLETADVAEVTDDEVRLR